MPKLIIILTTITLVTIVSLKFRRRKQCEPTSGSPRTRDLPKKKEQRQGQEDEGTWLSSFQTLQNTSDDFLNAMFSTIPDWSTDDFPSLEELGQKMTSLYPAFASQMDGLRESYEQFWSFFSMEEFRRIMEETAREDLDASLHPEIELDAQVRTGSELSKEESEFIQARKKRQCEVFAAFIGVDEVDERDIPIIGIASSGGGYRAMTAATGYLKSMDDTGMLGCVMYIAGVSGSTWSMAQFYSSLTGNKFDVLVDHLKSHIHTHIANVSNFVAILQASAQNAKTLMQGIIQRYHQQNGTLNLVDIFGCLLGGALLTHKQTVRHASPPSQRKGTQREEYSERIENNSVDRTIGDNGVVRDDDGTQVRPKLMPKSELKLSRQRRYFQDGSLPMPLYCVVHHEVRDLYRWFEFTPFEMGCEELNAWIPIWGFGRQFKEGKNIERLPEQTLGTLMGVFGSAFAASLAHFFEEIRAFLPEAALATVEATLRQYKESLLTIHPFSPARFPNPFYKLPLQQDTCLFDREYLDLLDAGCDNNLPFYPLLRAERKVDLIVALDLSADIETAPHLERAEGYAKRRGIDGWPTEARWPDKGLGTCTIFKGSQTTVAYFPLITNTSYDADFNPQTAEFCSTWNFVYSAEQVAKLVGLGEANWHDNVDQMKHTLRSIWEEKKRQRLEKSL